MKKKEDARNEMILTTKQLSEIIDLTPRRIQQLAEEGILIKASRGQYKAVESIRKYIQHIQEKVGENEVDYYREKALHEKAKREKAEMIVSVMKGDLHRAEDVKFVMNDMISAFRTKTMSLPAKLAPQLIGKSEHVEIQGVLTREVREALTELSEYDPQVFYVKSSEYMDVNTDEDEEE
jgi:phage terminase Nu1 subunit (DNA packaging protein)